MRRDPLRVLLVDDDQVFLEAMAATLRDVPEAGVVGFALRPTTRGPSWC